MKQTAVEWLVEQFTYKTYGGVYTTDGTDDVTDIVKQAKEMEKEQMKTLYSMWIVDKKTMELYDFEQYYNETFKSE